MENEDLKNRFTYHPPKDFQPEKYEYIRNGAFELSIMINQNCPDSREKSLAITKIEEAVMWANAAIVRNAKRTN